MCRETVTEINRSLAQTLRLCGPAVLVKGNDTVVKELSEILLQILTKKHSCQLDVGDEAEEEDTLEESSEYDWLLIDTALDDVVALAVALGPQFTELWPFFEKAVFKFASSQESIERTAAMGTLAECIAAMGDAGTKFTSKFLTVLLRRLTDEDFEVKANASYGIGLLCFHSKDDSAILPKLESIYEKVEPMLDDSSPPRVKDNAVGCVSRIIMRFPGKVPLDQVLPIVIKSLPLQEDFQENKPVFDMIVQLRKLRYE
jgi:importin-4